MEPTRFEYEVAAAKVDLIADSMETSIRESPGIYGDVEAMLQQEEISRMLIKLYNYLIEKV